MIFVLQAIAPGADADKWDSDDCGRNDKCGALPHTHHIFQYDRPDTLSGNLRYQKRFYTGHDADDIDVDNQQCIVSEYLPNDWFYVI